jgi:hypothetical protein
MSCWHELRFTPNHDEWLVYVKWCDCPAGDWRTNYMRGQTKGATAPERKQWAREHIDAILKCYPWHTRTCIHGSAKLL